MSFIADLHPMPSVKLLGTSIDTYRVIHPRPPPLLLFCYMTVTLVYEILIDLLKSKVTNFLLHIHDPELDCIIRKDCNGKYDKNEDERRGRENDKVIK